MLDYIIKALIFQTLFLAAYDLFLKRETFFQWNRAYLIGTSILAYVIPLIKFEQVSNLVPQEYIVRLPQVMLTPTAVIKENFDWSTFLFSSLRWVFWLGVFLATLLFFIKLTKIFRLIYNNEKVRKHGYLLILLESENAFSFFNNIFLGKNIKQENKEQIVEHELVHVRQKHSLDLLLFEFQRIIFWFNPFSYLYQYRMAELHEFIADSKAIKVTNKTNYFQNLLAQTFSTQKNSIINPFFKHSLIKKRILMLNKNRSKQFLKLKYLLLIPIFSGMFMYSSCKKGESAKNKINEKRQMTIFIKSVEDGKIIETQAKGESYFDFYMKEAKPLSAKEISYFDLTPEEKEDFSRFRRPPSSLEDEKGISAYKIYEMEDGRKAIWENMYFGGEKGKRP